MTETINKQVENVLNELHHDSRNDYIHMGQAMVKSVFRPMQPEDFKHAYLPISKEQGHALRQLIIQNDSKNIVEFGTSFGISTIYLADAVRCTGGAVVTTELLESKANKAAQNISKAGLKDYVDIKIGDAMETLKEYVWPIDFLFLDGWKDLYLPLFKMLEPLFHFGTLIYADNMDMADTKYFGEYILANKDIYSTRLVHQGKAVLVSRSS